MRIDITSNAKAVLKGMEQHARQAPYAISRAINDTADELVKAETTEIKRKVDRPTPFTMRTWAMQRSSKARLTAAVYAREIQAAYLLFSEEGGSRTPKNRANVVPEGVRVNQYGNMPNKAVKKMIADKKRYFSGVPRGWDGARPGIWRRMGTLGSGKGRKALRLEVAYIGDAHYTKRTDFHGVAQRLVQQRFETHLRKRIGEAVASAR
jgi:hypothetical protein